MFLRLFSSSRLSALLSFAAVYLVAAYYFHQVSSRDPTSLFFNPRQAYAPAYSTVRQEEAEAFVLAAANAPEYSIFKPTHAPRHKRLCVGIPSVSRKGAEYLRTAVGSLLEGLTPKERDDIHLIVFIPHTDPDVHPAYSETWLSNLTDEVLVYDLPQDQMEHIAQLEKDAGLFREKGLFDYAHLMKACYTQETPYITMFEDDVIAMDGWYHRTVAALKQAETLSALKKASWDCKEEHPFFKMQLRPAYFVIVLYLRLFYTEEFLGWNSEDWPSYLTWSVFFVTVPAATLALVRPYSLVLKKLLSNRVILGFCGICLPPLIALFFAAGKVTVLPLPTGVNEMSNHGCCSQGLVFPREKAMTLVQWFEMKKIGFVDVLTEEYADQHGELRWALTPSVIQHIGRKSSKLDDFGPSSKYQMSVAEKIWNFAFERNNAADLRREHIDATQKGR